MRITVNSDPDVEELRVDAMQGQRQSLEKTLSQANRAGPGQGSDLRVTKDTSVVRAQPMGLRAGIHPRRLNQLADECEAETYRLREQPLP